jgi:protocatechuate 3,4-dioxygenase beta subunit
MALERNFEMDFRFIDRTRKRQPGPISQLILGVMLTLLLAACNGPAADSTIAPSAVPPQATLAQTTSASAPDCNQPAALTPAMTEGPYFKAGSPERASLLDTGLSGTQLVLSGYVLTTDCRPVANALLDFWQADANGQYDNAGYTLRGHQFTDANGHYQLTTIVPGLYPGRTEHLHVKVQAPNGPTLTTQLFFPGVAQNDSDGIFDPRLLMAIQKTAGGEAATFNFVVSTQ